ncbi:MAG: hypothetical protein LBM75_07995 [Myxococcales bacterium]|jgi:hypothetical protein|nr:hypothetical protein [Myxococcales bacterium]
MNDSSFDDDGGGMSDPLPAPMTVARLNPLAVTACVCAFLPLIGAFLAIVLAAIALTQIDRSRGRLFGGGWAKLAILLSLIQLAVAGVLVHGFYEKNRQTREARAEAHHFLHDFTRYQEDESFKEKAQARMNPGLRVELSSPRDEHLSFAIADALGAFHSLDKCRWKMATADEPLFLFFKSGYPLLGSLRCVSAFALNGPPIETSVGLVRFEGERWQVAAFGLKSLLSDIAFTAEGRIMRPIDLPEFDGLGAATRRRQAKSEERQHGLLSRYDPKSPEEKRRAARQRNLERQARALWGAFTDNTPTPPRSR